MTPLRLRNLPAAPGAQSLEALGEGLDLPETPFPVFWT